MDPNGTGDPNNPPTKNRIATRIPQIGIKFERAKRLTTGKPKHPADLEAQGIEGMVTVMISLDATGKIVSAKIIKKSPYDEFNKSALAFIKKQKFSPAKRGGKPTASSFSSTIRFQIED